MNIESVHHMADNTDLSGSYTLKTSQGNWLRMCNSSSGL